MIAVTNLGNTFRVRHHETHIAELPEGAYDYFTGRVVTILHMLLSQSGRLADLRNPAGLNGQRGFLSRRLELPVLLNR